jgi:hypothetical protein
MGPLHTNVELQTITSVPMLITGTRDETGRTHPELTLAAGEFDTSLLAERALSECRVCRALLVLQCLQPRVDELGGSPGRRGPALSLALTILSLPSGMSASCCSPGGGCSYDQQKQKAMVNSSNHPQ